MKHEEALLVLVRRKGKESIDTCWQEPLTSAAFHPESTSFSWVQRLETWFTYRLPQIVSLNSTKECNLSQYHCGYFIRCCACSGSISHMIRCDLDVGIQDK